MREDKNGFFERVYALVATSPPGKVMTYGQIAALLGGVCSAKIVGYAMNGAPAERGLPCLRVVNKAGEPAKGGLFGGAENHRRLLESEGVVFTPAGRIDMAACLFHPAECDIPPPSETR